MASQLFANNATTTTLGQLSTTATQVVVNSSTGFPNPTAGDFFVATLDGGGNYNEIVKVTAVSNNVWTIIRAQEGTTPKLWQPGSRIECRITAGTMGLFAGQASSDNISFIQAGTGAVTHTAQDKMRENVSVKDFGATGDGVTDDTTAILTAAQYAKSIGARLIFTAGTYMCADFLFTMVNGETLDWFASGKVILNSNKTSPRSTGGSLDFSHPGLGEAYDSDYFIRTQPTVVGQCGITQNLERGVTWIPVSNINLFSVGSLVKFSSTRLIQTEARGANLEGQLSVVEEVDIPNNRVRIRDPLEYTVPINTVTNGTVASVAASDHLVLSGIALPDAQARVKCVFTTRNGFSYISRFNQTTGDAYYRGLFAYPIPVGVTGGDPVQLVWTTTITVYSRYGVNLAGNFVFTRNATTNAIAGDLGYRGLDIQYAAHTVVEDITIENFSETGLRLHGCYRPVVKQPYIYGSNRAYTTSNGTGYGISVSQCYAPLVEGLSASNCRRGLDFIGFDAITWYGVCRDTQFTGGGHSYTGEAFWPLGTLQQSAVGSHGASYYSKYVDITARDCRQGIVIRGYRERVQDAQFTGYTFACIYMQEGGTELDVNGATYEDGITDVEWGSEYQTTTIRQNIARQFAYVTLTSDTPNIAMSVKNVRCSTISQCFIGVDTTSTLDTVSGVFTLEMGNCVAHVSNVGASPVVNSFNALQLNPLLTNVRLQYNDLGGNRFIGDGSHATTNSKIQFAVVWNQIPGEITRLGDDEFVGCISDQTVLRVPVSANAKMCILDIFDRELDRAYRGASIILGAGRNVDYSPLLATNKTGITIQNVVLTGTTGTAGNMNIAFRPSGGSQFLYLENRLGGEMRPIFRLRLID